ncbi:lipoprotein [Aquibacillus saliphilus]|uniref:lipoprotein n=1 Tax=Aquibacillus saliphilus TaxID=1909422 RepID=UPI001CF018ED|nr:lipoprotein [Aquibacillus saliphilus]
MKKYLFILLIIPLLAGCQNEVRDNAEFNLGNISLSAFENNTKYFVVTPFEWEGEDGTTLKSIHIVNSQGENLSAEKGISATFYIGDSFKKTGVYVREDIGDKEKVNGYKLTEEQTLIMETSLASVKDDSAKNLKFIYETNGEEYEKVVEWNTLSTLRTND